MDSFELNKIAGAVLSALLVIFGMNVIVDLAKHGGGGHGGKKMAGYELPAATGGGAAPTAGGGAPAAFDAAKILAALPKANADAGKAVFKKCAACHTANDGGANRVGPNLWGIVGRKKAASAGFNYSGVMKGMDGDWSYADLAKFLHDPKGYASGTKMAFAGVTDSTDLADVIAYLRSLSASPAPLPK